MRSHDQHLYFLGITRDRRIRLLVAERAVSCRMDGAWYGVKRGEDDISTVYCVDMQHPRPPLPIIMRSTDPSRRPPHVPPPAKHAPPRHFRPPNPPPPASQHLALPRPPPLHT